MTRLIAYNNIAAVHVFLLMSLAVGLLPLGAAAKHKEKMMSSFDYFSPRWKRLAAAVMRRDGYKCQLSQRYGKAAPAEVVHHIYPVDEYPEYAYCTWNLISLSRAAHNRLHDRNTNALTSEGIALMRRTHKPDDKNN